MSLTGAYDPDNVFAKILRGDMPSVTVWEDEHALAIMDVFPQAPGHVLVLPKTAARNLFDLPAEALAHLTRAVQTVARGVRDGLQPDGVVITQFNGAPAGQTVFHLHFHIIPRREGEAVGRHAEGGMADMEELKAQAARIAAAISTA